VSHGIYSGWDPESDALPTLVSYTDTVPARLGIEFGYILRIRKARGKKLRWRIEHPPFPGKDGAVAPPFTGQFIVPASDYHFFLGDTIWEPVADKLGDWTLSTVVDEREPVRVTLHLVAPPEAENES